MKGCKEIPLAGKTFDDIKHLIVPGKSSIMDLNGIIYMIGYPPGYPIEKESLAAVTRADGHGFLLKHTLSMYSKLYIPGNIKPHLPKWML